MNLLTEITVLLLAAALAAPFGKISRVGSVLAFVGTGVLIGPWGLALINGAEDILHFAETGVVFLLFLIGLELQPKRLWALRKLIFGAGCAQLTVTGAVLFLLLQMAGMAWQGALVASYGLALSSTAFALRLLADNSELSTSQGRLAFGILLFQDLAVIPLLAVLPLLAGTTTATGNSDEAQVGFWLALLMFSGFILVGRYLLLPFLRLVAWTRVSEAFTATALLLVLGSALLMQTLGLSMGLGAFLAGMLVADSEYRHQLEADIEPFKALLLGLFFMAVGMSVNLGILTLAWPVVLGGVLVLIIVKSLVLYATGRLYQLNHGKASRLAAYLCQGGEFGFVAFTAASGLQILSPALRDELILVVTLSMALTPLVLKAVALLQPRQDIDPAELEALKPVPVTDSQVIIAGFGRFGQILGRVLNGMGILYTAIDINPEQVKLVRQFGNQVYYGDVSRLALLETAQVGKAKIFALCVDNVEASLRIVELLKKHYPDMKIFARARNRHHEIKLKELQVSFVIRETLLSSLAFTQRVLQAAGLKEAEAAAVVKKFEEQDRRLIQQQEALVDDTGSMVQSVHQAAAELKSLLQSDLLVTAEGGQAGEGSQPQQSGIE